MLTLPTLTTAPTEAKLTSSSFGPAPVSSLKFCAVSVSTGPSWMRSVSTLNWSALKWPFSNSTVARSASSLLSVPSVIVPLTGLPGRKRTPPEAKKRLAPSSRCAPWLSKWTPKFVTPTRRSSNSRMPLFVIGPPFGRMISVALPSLKPSVRTVRPGIRFGLLRSFGFGSMRAVTPNAGKLSAALSTVRMVCASPLCAAGS